MENRDKNIENKKTFETIKRWLVFIMIFLLTNPDKEIIKQFFRYKNTKTQTREARKEILDNAFLDIQFYGKTPEQFEQYVKDLDDSGKIANVLVRNIETYNLLSQDNNNSIVWMREVLKHTKDKEQVLNKLRKKLHEQYPNKKGEADNLVNLLK